MSRDTTRNANDRPPPYVKVAAQLGHQISIECRGTGVPDVSIAWQKSFRPSKMNDDLSDYPETDNSDEDGNLYDTRDGTNQESVESKKRKYKLKNRQNKQKKDYPIAEFNQV